MKKKTAELENVEVVVVLSEEVNFLPGREVDVKKIKKELTAVSLG